MDRDNRGGHNRKKVNEDFFKTWSPKMAYVLGFIYADGMIEDCRQSSRTCYTSITNTDMEILDKIRSIMSSNHPFEVIPAKINHILGKDYLCKPRYVFRIGNKKMYADLVSFGLCPKKSLIVELPEVPEQYFHFFLRGYFDGDGCIHIEKSRRRLKIIFSSGSKKFLEQISSKIKTFLGNIKFGIYANRRTYNLTYGDKNAEMISNFIYQDIVLAPYLKYKHSKYLEYMSIGK
jgi:hypothetical protein